MPLDFPNSPNVNDTFTSNGRSWKWDGTTWNLVPIAHVHPMADLVDFAVGTPATGQALVYNGTKWANAIIPTAADLATKAPTTSPTFTGTVTTGASVDIIGGNMTAAHDWTTAQLEIQASSTGSPGIAMHAPGASTGNLRHPRGTQTVEVMGNAGYTDVGANRSIRNIFINTGTPSGGSDGDVWMTYTP